MRKGIFLFLCLWPVLGLQAQSSTKTPANLLAIDFEQVAGISKLSFVLDREDVKANKFFVDKDRQIIIDLKYVQGNEKVLRAFDTSEFKGSVIFVSPYPKPGSPQDIRVAIQLRENVRSVLKKLGARYLLEIENRYGAFNQKNRLEGLQAQQQIARDDESIRFNIPKSDRVEDILENLTLSGKKKYIGKRISLNIKSVAIDDVLKMIAEASGFNIIITNNATSGLPPLTLNLTNVPWDQALDTILGLNKLVAKKNGIILMIQSLQQAIADRQSEERARQATAAQIPLVSKVFPISYAELAELKKTVDEYLTPKRGRTTVDIRTNYLIVRDTAEVIERIKKIIKVLDTQTPQVQIESKIVEVNEEYSRNIGLEEGISWAYDPVTARGDLTDAGSPGFSFSSATGSLLGINFSQVGRFANVALNLQLLEAEEKSRTISSSKVVTQNNQIATFTGDRTSFFTQVTTDAETGDRLETFVPQNATFTFSVTPQVTNEGAIAMQIALQKTDFIPSGQAGAPSNTTSSNVTTNTLVENGSTIVIGGLYEHVASESRSGVPFLMDIPIIGWLFRTRYNPTKTKREVLIFVTPRIINQEKAGIADSIDG